LTKQKGLKKEIKSLKSSPRNALEGKMRKKLKEGGCEIGPLLARSPSWGQSLGGPVVFAFAAGEVSRKKHERGGGPQKSAGQDEPKQGGRATPGFQISYRLSGSTYLIEGRKKTGP